jgi:hypothetical protein
MSGNGKNGLKANNGNILFNSFKKMIEGTIKPRSHMFASVLFFAAFVRCHQKLYSMRNDHF